MALPQALNTFTHTQLNYYTHDQLYGTLHFGITVTVSSSRDIISRAEGFNKTQVIFLSTAKIDAWECRATLEGTPHGAGIGLLVSSGGTVEANTNVIFDIPYTALTLGDGIYRISVYVKLNDIWYGG